MIFEWFPQYYFQIEEEKDKTRQKDAENTELSNKFADDCKGLNMQIDELNSKIKSLESIITSKNTLIEQLVRIHLTLLKLYSYGPIFRNNQSKKNVKILKLMENQLTAKR